MSCFSYLSGQGQEVAVELHIGHDLCQVLVVLYILIELQEHAMATQHEGHLLLDNSARQRGFVFLNTTYNGTVGLPYSKKERTYIKSDYRIKNTLAKSTLSLNNSITHLS